MSFSIATFNANNLFARYRFISTYPGDKSGKSKVSQEYWGYLPMYNEDMFDLFNPSQRELTAQVISADTLPDVLCLQEVESLVALRLFDSDFLSDVYQYRLLVDSRDFRQIDVAVLSRYPLYDIRTHIDDIYEEGEFEGEYAFGRDCLEFTVNVNGINKPLTLFVCHLKSKYSESQEELERGNRRRLAESKKVVDIVKNRFPGGAFNKELFAVVGDFNDTPESLYVKPLAKDCGLISALDRIDSPLERWTYYYKWQYQVSQIDYILMSPALDKLTDGQKPVIERRGIGYKNLSTVDQLPLPREIKVVGINDDDPPKVPFRFERFETVSNTSHASDHCMVSLKIAD